jgi:hypothetical protein
MPRFSKPSLPFGFTNQNTVRISHLSHVCYMPYPSHPPSIDHLNNISWSVQIMKLLIMRSFQPLASSLVPNILLSINNFCRILTMAYWYWTNCAFGLYPSSGVSRTNKIEV